MVQWYRQHLRSTKTQVQSLAQHNGLKDTALLQLLQVWLGSDPSLGTLYAAGQLTKKKKEKENKIKSMIGENVVQNFHLVSGQ